MPFPKELLSQDERPALDLRPHWWYFAPSAFYLAIAVIIGIFFLVQLEGHASWEQGLKFLAGMAVLVTLGYFAIRYAKWSTTNFVVTNERVIARSGVVAKKGIEIPLDRINTVFFHQSFFERVLGQGDLGIESAGERGTETFENVRKPALVQNEIYRQMEANATRIHGARSYQAAPTQPGPDASSIPAQLSQLDDLRKRGVITEAEFAAKKAELLNRM
jgi:uncharacterized membrane protein YdbT with pleckstrin-like domain